MRCFPVIFLLALLSCDAGRGDEPPRLLLIGWDGASYRMIDRLVSEGKLPTVARLMDRGVHARLESTIIPISSAAWTSAVTGKGPGETGVYGFFEPLEGANLVELGDASHGMTRTEIRCKRCDAHLGHVFESVERQSVGIVEAERIGAGQDPLAPLLDGAGGNSHRGFPGR